VIYLSCYFRFVDVPRSGNNLRIQDVMPVNMQSVAIRG